MRLTILALLMSFAAVPAAAQKDTAPTPSETEAASQDVEKPDCNAWYRNGRCAQIGAAAGSVGEAAGGRGAGSPLVPIKKPQSDLRLLKPGDSWGGAQLIKIAK